MKHVPSAFDFADRAWKEILLATVLRARGSVARRAHAQSENIYYALKQASRGGYSAVSTEPGDRIPNPTSTEFPHIWGFNTEDYGNSELKKTLQTILATNHAIVEDMDYVLRKLETIKREELQRWKAHLKCLLEKFDEWSSEYTWSVKRLTPMSNQSFANYTLVHDLDEATITKMIEDMELDLGDISDAKQTWERRLQA